MGPSTNVDTGNNDQLPEDDQKSFVWVDGPLSQDPQASEKPPETSEDNTVNPPSISDRFTQSTQGGQDATDGWPGPAQLQADSFMPWDAVVKYLKSQYCTKEGKELSDQTVKLYLQKMCDIGMECRAAGGCSKAEADKGAVGILVRKSPAGKTQDH